MSRARQRTLNYCGFEGLRRLFNHIPFGMNVEKGFATSAYVQVLRNSVPCQTWREIYTRSAGNTGIVRMREPKGSTRIFDASTRPTGNYVICEGQRKIMIGSNNYLGLAQDERVIEALVRCDACIRCRLHRIPSVERNHQAACPAGRSPCGVSPTRRRPAFPPDSLRIRALLPL